MCAIYGLLDPELGKFERQEILRKMGSQLQHRGPDSNGYWIDNEEGVALGHERLAILGLGIEGTQPMLSSSGRFVTSFNGEIYNYKQIAAELAIEGIQCDIRSDTAVLLQAVEVWGLDKTLERAKGMFAIAFYDRKQKKLTLVRDAMGEKPAYYGFSGRRFTFASDLGAINVGLSGSLKLSTEGIHQYLQYGYFPGELTVYEDVYKLMPGMIMQVEQVKGCWRRTYQKWWAYPSDTVDPNLDTSTGHEDASKNLEDLLHVVISEQLNADVPVGVLLSGGIDSTLVAAIAQNASDRPIQTYTVGFKAKGYDESSKARAVASFLNTSHHEILVDANDALKLVDELPEIYQEPFADSSQIPTVLISRELKQEVTVALSGDGGDEIFGGYNRYLWARRIGAIRKFLPPQLRHSFFRWLLSVPQERFDKIGSPVSILTGAESQGQLGEKIHKLARSMLCSTEFEIYRNLLQNYSNPALPELSNSAVLLDHQKDAWSKGSTFAERMMFSDALGYLPDDILVKVDRAAMSVGLETRIPLLDQRIVSFASAISQAEKITDGRGKMILRKILGRYIPGELINRSKHGFSVPLKDWLRGPLREWASDLLLDNEACEGIIDRGYLSRLWGAHLSGASNNQEQLWTFLMLFNWMKTKQLH
jgi:asparagine synthase (glutamine-hydrolysing)